MVNKILATAVIMRFIIVFSVMFMFTCVTEARELPRFPDMAAADSEDESGDDSAEQTLVPPAPLPKRLLERPKDGAALPQRPQYSVTKQTAFDGLDPTNNIIPNGILDNGQGADSAAVPLRPMQQRRTSGRQQTSIIDDGSYYIAEGKQSVIVPQSAVAANEPMSPLMDDGTSLPDYYPIPVMPAFGTGTLDNLQIFTATTSFKDAFSQGRGSFGLSEGFNLSAPATMSGAFTVQGGMRFNQFSLHDRDYGREQTYITAGVFKRLESKALQGGVAFDWMNDRIRFYNLDTSLTLLNQDSYKFKQMRAEISMRSFRGFEYGFQGGFVMDDEEAEVFVNTLSGSIYASLQSYYQFFGRYMLPSGGQVEGKIGATAWGDIVLGINGQAAVGDKLTVTAGVSVLSPSDGRSADGNYKEAWSMSLGIIYYFRGGATNFINNAHRPMFDVAGNDSAFLRVRE
jgi:hypothetical protein